MSAAARKENHSSNDRVLLSPRGATPDSPRDGLQELTAGELQITKPGESRQQTGMKNKSRADSRKTGAAFKKGATMNTNANTPAYPCEQGTDPDALLKELEK